jgi:hypothetical protein
MPGPGLGGCPFACSCTHDAAAGYEAGMLPATAALLAPYGVRIRDGSDAVMEQGERFPTVAARHMG